MSQQSRTEIATEFLEWCAAGRVQEAFDRYKVDDPTATRGVVQEGGDA